MFKLATQEVPELNKPVIIQFPMDIYGDRFAAGDQIEAWYFDIDTGKMHIQLTNCFVSFLSFSMGMDCSYSLFIHTLWTVARITTN